MSNLPVKVNDLPVQAHVKQRLPGRRPIKVTKGRPEFSDTMGPTGVDEETQLVTGLAGKRGGRKLDNPVSRPEIV